MHRFRPRAVFPRLPPSRVKMAKLSNTWSSVQRTFTRFAAVPRFGPICPDMAARRPTFSRNCSRYSAIVSRPSLAGSHSHSNNYIAPVPGRLAARPPAGSIIGFMGTPAFRRSFRYGRMYTPRPSKRCARPAKPPILDRIWRNGTAVCPAVSRGAVNRPNGLPTIVPKNHRQSSQRCSIDADRRLLNPKSRSTRRRPFR